jgi:hypothetical protein
MDLNDSVVSHSAFSLVTDQPSNPAAVKFGLYVKTHEIRQIEQSLRQIMLLPKTRQRKWLTDHEAHLSELLDSFVSDSTLALDGLQLDGEALELSIEFVTVLRDVMNTIRSLFSDRTNLTS